MRKYRGLTKVIALGVGIMIFILAIREDLFQSGETIGYYIFAVVGLMCILSFIIGMIWLIVIDYLNYRKK